jgi:hypothetical protein
MNRLYGIVLSLAESLRLNGDLLDALQMYFLLMDLRASADLESSRFLREREVLTKSEDEQDVREAYKSVLIPGGSIERVLQELIRSDLALDATAVRVEFDRMVEAYHIPLCLEAEPERIWTRMRTGRIIPSPKKASV